MEVLSILLKCLHKQTANVTCWVLALKFYTLASFGERDVYGSDVHLPIAVEWQTRFQFFMQQAVRSGQYMRQDFCDLNFRKCSAGRHSRNQEVVWLSQKVIGKAVNCCR